MEEEIYVKNSSSSRNETENIDSFYFYEVEQFTLLWILFFVIVIGNGGVLYTLLKNKSRNHRMNYFIRHLAIADLLVGMINVLTDIIWRMTVSWNIGNVACKIIKFLQVLVTYASTYVLVALSIDRYDAIRYPMKFSSSWTKARCLIWSAWIISGLISTPILVFYNEKVIQDRLQCWIEFPSEWQWRVYMTLVTISLFVIPVTIISVCYTVIIVIIWSKSKALMQHSNRSFGKEGSNRVSSSGVIPKAKIKTIKITLIIVTVFVMCWSPYMIFDLLQVYGHISTTQTNIAIATFIQSLAPLNSAANPIIYVLFSTHVCRNLGKLPPFSWIKAKCTWSVEVNQNQSSTMSEFLTNSKQSTNQLLHKV